MEEEVEEEEEGEEVGREKQQKTRSLKLTARDINISKTKMMR